MDIFDRIRQERGPLGQHARDTHGYFTFPKLEGEISNRMTFRGKELLVWSINNYLGLANHPEIRKVDAEGAAEWGMGYPMGARMMSGQTAQHEALEQELADFMQKEDAFVLNYGYQGCQSAIEALVSRHDVIVYDSESHACMVDADCGAGQCSGSGVCHSGVVAKDILLAPGSGGTIRLNAPVEPVKGDLSFGHWYGGGSEGGGCSGGGST